MFKLNCIPAKKANKNKKLCILIYLGRVHRPHPAGGPAGVQVLPGEEGGGERGQTGQGGGGPGVPAAGPANQAGGVRPGRGTSADGKIASVRSVST